MDGPANGPAAAVATTNGVRQGAEVPGGPLPPPPVVCIRGVCGTDVAAVTAAAAAAPTGWSPADTWETLSIAPDKRRATYDGVGLADADAASGRTDVPIPSTAAGVVAYYYELTVVSAGECGFIGFGLSKAGTRLRRLPGWEPGTVGYHADDGHRFVGSGVGGSYGPTWTTGDTVGCLWEVHRGDVSFTKNGVHLGVARTGLTANTPADALYPMVGMRTRGEDVEACWGLSAEDRDAGRGAGGGALQPREGQPQPRGGQPPPAGWR
ncbi:hypothetical protein BU14_0255s0013 [Porphyra umbilicalis]|uniref:B30.2/SPRY domain-containing protein n=1 Tax=Porphyra umbilicalis TaxID=2786 RepID=A0A1X6P2V8_PORUM|nr:hypothetical protein BU14_0255s0013 [Porphyra umbilicalis]|eukprot:OSX75106.1 hypothetical protein BU14_0255s0013 [Porphyra umbilicalis]